MQTTYIPYKNYKSIKPFAKNKVLNILPNLKIYYTMKNLKFSIVIILLALFFSATVKAQTEKSLPEDQKEEMLQQMQINKERLALTATQEPTFKDITKKYALKMKELKASNEGKKDKFQKMKAIKNEKNTEMKTLLSDKQYKTYLTLQEERKEKIKDRKKQ